MASPLSPEFFHDLEVFKRAGGQLDPGQSSELFFDPSKYAFGSGTFAESRRAQDQANRYGDLNALAGARIGGAMNDLRGVVRGEQDFTTGGYYDQLARAAAGQRSLAQAGGMNPYQQVIADTTARDNTFGYYAGAANDLAILRAKQQQDAAKTLGAISTGEFGNSTENAFGYDQAALTVQEKDQQARMRGEADRLEAQQRLDRVYSGAAAADAAATGSLTRSVIGGATQGAGSLIQGYALRQRQNQTTNPGGRK